MQTHNVTRSVSDETSGDALGSGQFSTQLSEYVFERLKRSRIDMVDFLDRLDACLAQW
jgi:hypothetical protein